MKHIVFFHLFNDYSKSSKVLKMVLDGVIRRVYKTDLVTSKGGVLDGVSPLFRVGRFSYPYRFFDHSTLTALNYCAVQIYTFFLSFRWMFKRNVVFYINTLLPVGPALAGRMMGKRVIYHYHENAAVKGLFYRILAFFMQHLAHEIICVSAYQAHLLHRKKQIAVVPNAVNHQFLSKLHYFPEEAFRRQRVLMLGSLKLYKGPIEFIQLAQRLPQFSFELVVNDTQEHIDEFISEKHIEVPQNLTLFARQNDVAPFYNRASLVLNLSNQELFIETFGLTALEAMSAGLPVIVPPVGGIAEMVEDGVNGYKMEVQHLDEISDRILEILTNKNLYLNLSRNALKVSCSFDETTMIERIVSFF